MKKTLLLASFVLIVGSGCGSSNSARRTGESARYPRQERVVTRDPAVGRTADGRTVYEDRNGRVYTEDRSGRRIYQDADEVVYSGRAASRTADGKKVKTNRKPDVPPGHTANPSDRGKKVGHDKAKPGKSNGNRGKK